MLAVVGALTLASSYRCPRPCHPSDGCSEPLWRAFGTYGRLLRQRRLLGYAGVGGFLYGGIFAYVAGTPFAYITYHHVLPQHYGLLFALGSVGIMTMNLVNVRLVSRLGSDRLLRAGAFGACVMGRHGDRRAHRLRRARGPGPAVVPVRLVHRIDRGERHHGRAEPLSGRLGLGVRADRRQPVRRGSSARRWTTCSPTERPGRWAR